jgi:predicted AAA+ superfamily ATPase
MFPRILQTRTTEQTPAGGAIVVVSGARQMGKRTLVRRMAKDLPSV